ncbi:MAG: PepSY domain-containing protein [Erysipelotrichaceae bacterium]|nr:PepSY domain-containing protein [Erysipelotrichaceae bacterium]
MTKLYDAFSKITPDNLDAIHEELQHRDENIIVDMPTPKKKRYGSLVVALLAVILIVCTVTFYPSSSSTIMAKVDIDVNPSIEFSIDANNKIVEAIATNEDGKNILGDMDFTGSDIEVGINAVIGSMLMQGYIDELKNSLLVSVIGDNEETNEQLRTQLTTMIEALLQSSSIDGSIMSLTLTDTSSIEDIAKEYNISVGKAEIIQKLIEFNSNYSYETLKDLSIHDLNILLENYNVTDVTLEGTASVSEYIGQDKAKSIALEHANVSESDISEYEIEMDYEDGTMVYEIEFKVNGIKYEYEINAYDGTLINDEPINSSSSSSTTSSSTFSTKITKDEALQKALSHAGISKSNVSDLDIEYDKDDNIYEVSFEYKNYEYEYEINANDGSIINYEKDYDD